MDSIDAPAKPVKECLKDGFVKLDFPAHDEGYAATGFSITPELRYYLSKKKAAPRGTYLAPNYRYQKGA